MSTVPEDASLEVLLDKLHRGDLDAAEELIKTYEPYLRLLVRRQLPVNIRAKFDSVDIVQSIWVDVLAGFRQAGWEFTDVYQLRAFLARVARNRLIDRERQFGRCFEQPLSPAAELALSPADQTSPSQQVQADELWAKMLTLCAPGHRSIIELKREGCDLAEIARRTSFHPSSVRRILYDLARRLALS
jgi:RNA polymerase sigma-70 factor (ECF subfamily)